MLFKAKGDNRAENVTFHYLVKPQMTENKMFYQFEIRRHWSTRPLHFLARLAINHTFPCLFVL